MLVSREDLKTPHRFAMARIRFAMCLRQLIMRTLPEMEALNSDLFVEALHSSPLSSFTTAMLDYSLLVSTPDIHSPKFNSHLEPDR